MPEQSSMHAYLNWAKQRIDEMDATLASLEAKTGQMKADSKVKADQLVADLKKRRDEFQAQAKAQAHAGEAALQAGKAQLETQWKAYEAQVKTYFDTVGKQIEQQQAWHEAADTFHKELAKVAAARQGDIAAAVKQMKADAAEAEARLQKMKQAGSDSWSGLSAALAESRKSFDRANQTAADAVKRASPSA